VFGVGLPEFAVIAVIAVLVFGPDKLPDLARQAGRLVRQARRLANTARDELRAELGPEYADLELRDLDPREIVRRHIAEAMDDDEEEPPARRRQPRRGLRPLTEGETPPYDLDAT
jgi:sec-independent protein translocase protein TatB